MLYIVLRVFLLLSRRKLLRLQVRGDDLLIHNHRQQLQFEVGGFLNQEALAAKRKECRRTHSQGSPSDSSGTQLLGSPHRKAYYVPLAVVLLSVALSVSRL